LRSSQVLLAFVVLALALAGCAPRTAEVAAMPTPTPCALLPVVVPTLPAEIAGYTELDETTGLHMTGSVQQIDLETYRLAITGTVDHPIELSYDDLRCMPKVEQRCTLVCPGFFADEATWAGAPLRAVLERAGLPPQATGLRLVSADGYSTFVPLADVLDDGFLAYEWEGEPLPILHGFPLRAVFPSLEGNKWVKWLVEIEVS
jgi:DMSO/TMAO reductase YedYZ molybdopterin-dependent catalytic subunit